MNNYSSSLAANSLNGYDPLSPLLLATYGPFLGVSTPDAQFYLKRSYVTLHLKNTELWPCHMQIVYARARMDLSASDPSVRQLMDDDVTGDLGAYMSWIAGNAFQKHFKVIKTVSRTMYPGKEYTIKHKDRAYVNKPITSNVEGNGDTTQLRAGTSMMFLYFYGSPVYSTAVGAVNNVSLSYYNIVGLAKYYYSWYSMDDDEPTAIVASNVGANDLNAQDYNATMYVGYAADEAIFRQHVTSYPPT